MKRESTFLFLLLAIPLSHPSEYSDVLLVSNANSTESLAIADYFARKHGVSHQLQVSLPLSDGIKFSELQEGLILPLKRYLDSSNSQINYIVLSKDIPLYTDETDVFATGYDMQAANASSVDSEVALIGSPFEQHIGQKGHVPNPYYGSSEPFSRKKFGILLVTRLDGYDFADVKSMIDRSDSIIPGELASGQHVLLGYRGVYANQLSAANTSLASAGLDVLFWQAPFANESISGVLHAKSQPRLISYYDAFGCYNLGGCNSSYYGIPNFSWANGSLVSIKYSFSARTSKPPK
ncbi:MAG: TIGR03790 family protein, partial [Candidatus Anstonellaceae archaeon]